jgi:transcriptional regulator with XRE-family HTH domain
VAARWLNISQAQLARIERGHPVTDLDRLIQWAKTLRIPRELLWFSLPDDGPETMAGVPAMPGNTAEVMTRAPAFPRATAPQESCSVT